MRVEFGIFLLHGRWAFELHMLKRSSPKFALGCALGACICLIASGAASLVFVNSFSGFRFILQDCLAIPRDIVGRVTTSGTGLLIANASVEITTDDGEVLKSGKTALMLVTDAEGRFEERNIYIFACSTIHFKVTAPNQAIKEFSFLTASEVVSGRYVPGIDADGYGSTEVPNTSEMRNPPILPRMIRVALP